MRAELSALIERERAPVAQWIRAADFGPSRPMRCGIERGRGERNGSSYLLSFGGQALVSAPHLAGPKSPIVRLR